LKRVNALLSTIDVAKVFFILFLDGFNSRAVVGYTPIRKENHRSGLSAVLSQPSTDPLHFAHNRCQKSPYWKALYSKFLERNYRLLFTRPSSSFPQSLKCYISDAPGKFPAQKHKDGQLKQYYLLNAASLLAVLALEIKNGEKVLDMCAAPGGKSIATLQYACPGLLQSNEYDNLRFHWLKQTLESFIPESLMSLITVSLNDGREIGNRQPEKFDKILVDAPCSNDRSWLFSSDTQRATLHLAQRKLLSAVQIQLLRPNW
uniref:NOP2/Sun RNA methyltransferase 3 n=1 Tax=Laticauda laticaudata TaxID=8630 RepID=A0A8C5WRX1_LATLA